MTIKSAAFDVIAPAQAEGDFVIRCGKYFELGEYPDKQFCLDETEADAAIEAFDGAPINLEHTHTLFDGKLGMVRRLWRQGRDVLAEYAIPAWLHRITGGEPIKISSEWDRETKRPIGAALVLSPRIQDAVMMSLGVSSEGETGGVGEWETARRESEETAAKVDWETPGGGEWERQTCSHAAEQVIDKEDEKLSLIGRLTAFLRGEGLLDEETRSNAEACGAAVVDGTDVAASPLRFSSSPEYRQMSAQLSEQAAVIAELRAQFAEEQSRATSVSHFNAITELVRQGKMTAGEAEQWQEVAQTHPEAFTAVLATLQLRPVLPQFHGDRNTRRISPNPEAPASRLISLSQERAARTGERYETAFSTVCRDNPELAAAHVASAPAYGGVGHE